VNLHHCSLGTIMSMPSHRLPPPVSQTVGGSAAAAAAAAATDQLSDVPATENSSVADPRFRSTVVQRQNAAVNDPPPMPGRQDSVSTSTKTADSKRPGPATDLSRPMRPKSVMKSHMKYLTPYEHQEIFDYPQVEHQRA